MNPILEHAIEELRHLVLDALGDHKAAVWLFGSCARGDVRQHSDIDIAVLPRDDLPTASPNLQPVSNNPSHSMLIMRSAELPIPRRSMKCALPK